MANSRFRESHVFLKPTAPRSIGGVLDDSIRLFRSGLARSWPLALAAQLLVAIPTLYFRLKLLGTVGVRNPQAMLAMYMSASFWLPYLVCTIAAIGFYNAVTLQLASEFQGTPTSALDSMRRGYRLLGRVLLMFLLFFLLWGMVAGAIALVFAFTGPIAPGSRMGIAGIVGVIAAPIVIYLLGRLYLTNTALLVDDLRVLESLKASWNLTRGHWWRGATIYSVILLIAIVFYFIIGFAVGLITYSFGPTSVAGAGLTELVSLLGTTLLLPLISAALLAIYHDFKLRTEGADLAGKVNALSPR
jgi:hypothetical protein